MNALSMQTDAPCSESDIAFTIPERGSVALQQIQNLPTFLSNNYFTYLLVQLYIYSSSLLQLMKDLSISAFAFC